MSDKGQRTQVKSDNVGVGNGNNHNANHPSTIASNNAATAATANGNSAKYPAVMMPNGNNNNSLQNNSRNMPPSTSIIPPMSIDAATLGVAAGGATNMMRMNTVGVGHHYHNGGGIMRNHHPSNYLINQQQSHNVGYNTRSDNRYPGDPQTKNNMNRQQYFRPNLMHNMAPHQGFNSYGFYNNKRKRRERTSFTKTQLSVLLETYAVQPYPDVQQRLDIAARIGLDESRVQVWFKNRRAKERKDELVANSIRANTANANSANNTNTNNNSSSSNTNQNNAHSSTVGANNSHLGQHHSILPTAAQQHAAAGGAQQNPSQSSQHSNSQDHSNVHHQQQQYNTSNQQQQQTHHMHHNLNPHDQFLQQNTQGNRYPTNMHLPNTTPFVELFGVSSFADENDVINQYADLMPNNQQDNSVSAFTMNPSAIAMSKEEAELLISSSPSLPKLQPLKQSFNDTPTKQNQ